MLVDLGRKNPINYDIRNVENHILRDTGCGTGS